MTRARTLGTALLLGATLSLTACGGWASSRSAVSLNMTRGTSPHDAAVFIDEEFVGTLGMVAARGIRLPEGEHRVTIERDGYFPWDRLVSSDRQAIKLDVKMVKIPD
ncbi:MAG: PEGA domain-containing protein [Polyangiaceae bacterium]|nr:PEGA domain-containing protein [Polyangiaceae bacterium]